NFSLHELKEAVAFAHANNAKIYVSVNTIIRNEQLEELPVYLRALQDMKVDAVIFGDPAVLMAMKEHNVSLRLHWSTEMTSTNWATAEYWAGKGAVRCIAARELNLEEIHEFKQRS